MGTLLQDIRYGVRMLLKNPGFTAIAVLTLALGIGANTAIFSVLDSVLLRTLPVAHPEQLVLLTDPDSHGSSFGSEGGDRSLLAYSEFQYLRDHNEVFSSIFASDSHLAETPAKFEPSSSGTASAEETIRVRLASGDYFSTLQVKPLIGRMFTPEMDRVRGGAPFAVTSYTFWKQRFNLDPAILGKTVQIHNTSFEIIGVAPPGFFGETAGEAADVWIPVTMQDAIYPGRDLLSLSQGEVNKHIWLQVIARLKPGITQEQAKASINVVFQRMIESNIGSTASAEERKEFLSQRINLQAGARGSSTLQGEYGQPLKVLMALVGFVLLIACANVANLLLARGAARQKEFAVRLAIGAGRRRLIRQLLCESLLLAFAGAAAGILLAQWVDTLLLQMVSRVSAGRQAIDINLRPDMAILGFTLAVAGLSAILFGLIPALRATRLDLSPILKSTAHGTAEPGSRRLTTGKVLVVAQVAISLILLVAAGLFVHSLSKLSEVKLGYQPESLLLFQVDGTAGGYKGPANLRFQQELLEKFSAVPGVRAATLSSNGLFSHSESSDPISVEGYTPKPGEEMHSRMDHIGPGYFSTVGIAVLMGREIGPQDGGNGPRAAVINQTFAKDYFANTNPLGKKVRDTYPGNPSEMEIVGIVADAKYNSLREKTPARIYAPYFNPMWEHSYAIYEIRTLADPASLSATLRKTVQQMNSAIPPIEIKTMPGLVDDSLHTDRFVAKLASVFGLLAMVLASIGLYGIMAYTVARRTRDIGIRMALGAQPGSVLWLVLRETLLLVVAGVAVGLPVAFAGTRLLKSMLFGLGLADPVAIVVSAMSLVVVAALAGFLPARRAMRVDPMVALRYE